MICNGTTVDCAARNGERHVRKQRFYSFQGPGQVVYITELFLQPLLHWLSRVSDYIHDCPRGRKLRRQFDTAGAIARSADGKKRNVCFACSGDALEQILDDATFEGENMTHFEFRVINVWEARTNNADSFEGIGLLVLFVQAMSCREEVLVIDEYGRAVECGFFKFDDQVGDTLAGLE